jgi:hypothetical protein
MERLTSQNKILGLEDKIAMVELHAEKKVLGLAEAGQLVSRSLIFKWACRGIWVSEGTYLVGSVTCPAERDAV